MSTPHLSPARRTSDAATIVEGDWRAATSSCPLCVDAVVVALSWRRLLMPSRHDCRSPKWFGGTTSDDGEAVGTVIQTSTG